ncbi:17752_t:CDS:1, partial [Gigaspora margarita]
HELEVQTQFEEINCIDFAKVKITKNACDILEEREAFDNELHDRF